jgi:ABC transporter DrrB family efflux protein
MTMLRGSLHLVRAHLWEAARSKASLFWTLAFPLGFLFLFCGVMARGEARASTFMMPGLFTNMLLGTALFAAAIRLVNERESGLLRRLRVTPVSALAVVLAHGVAVVVTQLITFALLWSVGKVVFGVSNAGSTLALLVTFLAGVFALLPLGLLVGSMARDSRSAPPIVNLLFFPMLFLSGAGFPFAFLPDAVQRVARFLPATYMVEALHDVMVRGESLRTLAPNLATLLLIGIVGIALNAMFFRWEGTDRVPRRALAIVVVGLGLALGAAAAFGPELRMSRMPGDRKPDAGAAQGQVRVLRGATVLDGLGGRIENARITIRDHRIAEVGVDSADALPEGAIVDDWRGRFVIPGLIDSHLHLGGSGGVGSSPTEHQGERQIRDTQALLGVGVTTIVSLTDDARDLRALREGVARGRVRAPRTFFAGAAITAPGGHPAAMFSFSPAIVDRLTRQVATAEEAERAVADLALRQVDLIKLVLESGPPSQPLPRLDEQAFRAAIAAAKKARLKTTVHVGRDVDVRLALDAGADGIEHVPGDLSDESIRMMAAKKVTLTPTLGIFDMSYRRAIGGDPLVRVWSDAGIVAALLAPDSPFRAFLDDATVMPQMQRLFAAQGSAVARAARAGVPILAGSDSGNPAIFHGPALIHELETLVESGGLTPLDALAAATSRAADRLGQKDLGRIAVSAVADLVVLDGDPAVEIGALRRVEAVYLGGLPLELATLLSTPPGAWMPGRND